MRRALVLASLLSLAGCGPSESSAPVESVEPVSVESAPAAATGAPSGATPSAGSGTAPAAPTAGMVTARPGPARPQEMEGGGYKLRLQVGTPQPRPAAPAPAAPAPAAPAPAAPAPAAPAPSAP